MTICLWRLRKTYCVWVASVGVEDGVPDGVEVADAVFAWNVLGVATAVARGELSVDEGSRVERLVQVADVVDDHTEGE